MYDKYATQIIAYQQTAFMTFIVLGQVDMRLGEVKAKGN